MAALISWAGRTGAGRRPCHTRAQTLSWRRSPSSPPADSERTDLSRRPPRPPCACSRAVPSPGKGTSTRGAPRLCSSARPARRAPSPPQSGRRPWRRGPPRSPAVCTPPGRRAGPSRRHRWCPRSPDAGPPLSLRSDRPRPPGAAGCCLRKRESGQCADREGARLRAGDVLTWVVGSLHR